MGMWHAVRGNRRGAIALLAATLAGCASHATLTDSRAAVAGAIVDAEQRCTALASYSGWGVNVTTARLTPEGRVLAEDGSGRVDPSRPIVPAHCLVQGVINQRTGADGREFGIGFDMRLPLDWNGRFAFHGGAGMDGWLMPAIGDIDATVNPPALTRGFAVISTNGGHSGFFTDASFGTDQQARIDYAYNALDKTTLLGKELVRAFYGSKPEYSYMLGCSNGGRQGLIASQRLPLHFDGIVSGDPSLRFSRIAIDEMWNQNVLAKIAPRDESGQPIISQVFSDADLQLVRGGVLKQCDALDGLKDGLIHDWQACGFDPGVLTCKGGKTASCLSNDQVGALRAMHEGPRTRDGTSIYGPFNYDTGIASDAWRGMRLGRSTSGQSDAADATLGLGQFSLYQLTPPEPGFDPKGPVDWDDVLERVRHTAALGDADSPFLNTFASRGKMIVYNGLSDQGMASSELVDWYDQVVDVNGESVRDSVRLFLIPGMTHCRGGEATDEFDMLDAIQAWVERGEAPDRIRATSRSIPGISRPLCPHPKVARYVGGDPASADSFECRE
ncbi:tannase/feruloyl esterase family alpha/beta hydrolase [Altericroceibacterium xinjiangense]|uniref:tannase/feruloyl esterase family alpha/beta hydrolase n=1 Tax=Altericroceibacterium xinjiangense TaxID=762261 RepID=UPI001F4994AF|nr:tannase/feruloyl esterase family alpha/beta hydrolase [Altericroceibacterium xinjiangense]